MRTDTASPVFGRLAPMMTLLTMVGCNNVSTSILVDGVIAPDAMCTFEIGADFLPSTVLNTNETGDRILQSRPVPPTVNQLQVALVARYMNNLTPTPTPVSLRPPEEFQLPNNVTPVRLDFRWECDSNGFTAGQGPLFLPQFSVNQPFCLDNRSQTGDFVGFDQVAATGGATEPSGEGLVIFRPIPAQLGLAIDEVFQLAGLANACCMEVGGDCEAVVNANTTGTGSCRNLQDLFNAVGDGSLQANQPAAVRRWQPFSIYNGMTPPIVDLATYPMRLRGRFEFITGSGSMLTSNEILHEVSVCRACGRSSTPCTDF